MMELKGVLEQGQATSAKEVYLKLAKSGSSYEVRVVHPDGSHYSCGILLTLKRGDNGKLDIYRNSCISPKLGEIFNLDSGNHLVKK